MFTFSVWTITLLCVLVVTDCLIEKPTEELEVETRAVRRCSKCVINLSERKRTWQSSTYKTGYSFLAVDGVWNPNYFSQSCTHTNKDHKSYWWVDLGGWHYVFTVAIQNRADSRPERLSHIKVMVGSKRFQMKTCAYHSGAGSAGVLCDIDPVIQENRQLKSELYKCKTEVELYRWSVDKIRGNDAKTRFYTGLPTFAIFMWLFNFLKAKASRMQYWSGSSQFKETDRQRSSQASLVLEDQLFSTLMRLRLGLLIQDIADRFHISCTTFSKYFITWVSLLHVELKTLNPFPSRATVNRTMPDSFKPKYESVRVILDCTEVYVQRSSSLLNQALTFSNYKHHNTLKFLIGITPSGVISFVSEAWGGRASDTHITLHSGLLDLLDENDCVMVDKGFLIEEALKKRKCKLAIPPFRGACAQFSTEQVFITQEIARLRIHVERAIGRVKNFHILDGVMPLTLAPLASQIFQVCSWLSNFDTPLVK